MPEDTPPLERMAMAQVASCTCEAKTPVIGFHDSMCHYRLLAEAYQYVADADERAARTASIVNGLVVEIIAGVVTMMEDYAKMIEAGEFPVSDGPGVTRIIAAALQTALADKYGIKPVR